MKILIACECSGVVRRAFRALGHDAWSCDLEPSEDGSPHHLRMDAIEAVKRGCEIAPGVFAPWDLIIAHPPCTYLANSGVRWLYDRDTGEINLERWANMLAGAKFFSDLWNACGDTPRAFENPVMHTFGKMEIIRLTQPSIVPFSKVNYIQPWEHGHMETKKTGLYLFGLPPLTPTNVVYDEMMKLTKPQRERVHHESPGPQRTANRSRTLTGIGAAMADQWSRHLAGENLEDWS